MPVDVAGYVTGAAGGDKQAHAKGSGVFRSGERQEIAYPTRCRRVFPDRPDRPGNADLRIDFLLPLASTIYHRVKPLAENDSRPPFPQFVSYRAAAPPDSTPTGAEQFVERYAALWVRRLQDEAEARMYVAASTKEHETIEQALEKEGFVSQQTLQAFRGADGSQRYCAVKRKGGEKSKGISNASADQYEGMGYRDQTQGDINLNPADKALAPQTRLRKQLAEAEKQLAANPEDVLSRLAARRVFATLANTIPPWPNSRG
jgi:hypothetical protein